MKYCVNAGYYGEEHSRTIYTGSLDECRMICSKANGDSLSRLWYLSISTDDGRIVERYQLSNLDMENPYIAEEIYWFVVNNHWEAYQETKAENPVSMAEYVKLYCLAEFEQAMKEKGYE